MAIYLSSTEYAYLKICEAKLNELQKLTEKQDQTNVVDHEITQRYELVWKQYVQNFVQRGKCYQPQKTLSELSEQDRQIFLQPERSCLLPRLCFIPDYGVLTNIQPDTQYIIVPKNSERFVVNGILFAIEDTIPDSLYIEILIDKWIWDKLSKQDHVMLGHKKKHPGEKILFFNSSKHIAEFCSQYFDNIV